jgi:hypothetical protein
MNCGKRIKGRLQCFFAVEWYFLRDTVEKTYCILSIILGKGRLREREGPVEPRRCVRHALQRQNAENSIQIFPEKEYRGPSPNFHIHMSVSELYIPSMGLPFLLEEICGPILRIYKSLTDTWMWKLGLRPRNSQNKEFIIGIAVAVWGRGTGGG